jgi:TrmH family RNA methyltransferase
MDPIQSLRNPKIKTIRALGQRKARQEHGLYVVEGVFHLGEALAAGAAVDYLCYSPDRLTSPFAWKLVEAWKAREIPCYPTTIEVYDSISEKQGSQGIIGVLRQQWTDLDSLTPQHFPWGVALVAPQDPGNLGTILRTINAVGASGLILLDGGADPYHPTAVRASMGALFHHPMAQASSAHFAGWITEHGYTVYGSSAQAAVDYRGFGTFQRPAILLLGSEREGLPEALRSLCTVILQLPMRGSVTSLNLAVAAGVLLYRMLEEMGDPA